MGETAGQTTILPALYLGAIGAAAIATLVLSWTDNSTDLTVGHNDLLMAVVFTVAVMTTIIVLGLVVWFRPPLRGPLLVVAPLLALPIGLMAGILAFFLTDRISQFFEFRGNVARYEEKLPVERAYISHGKGVSYHIQTATPFTDFQLSSDDYGNIFGKAGEVRPTGYCLRASVERHGDAMRIMYPSGRPIPSWQVRPCSAPTHLGS